MRSTENEAAAWVVRLDAEGAAADEEFSKWLQEDSRHAEEFVKAQMLWEEIGHRLRERAAEPVSVPPRARNRAGVWFGACAAAVVVLFVAGAAFTWLRGEEYATEIGKTLTVKLEDGSTVELNTDTVVRVPHWGNRRRVYLKKGEAHFTVRHEDARPFEVLAGEVVIHSLGTEFDVRLFSRQVATVIVSVGRVAIGETPHNRVKAGEIAEVMNGVPRVRELSSADVSATLQWRVGRLTFNGQKLSEVVAEINRYNVVQVVVADRSLNELQVGGTFRTTEPEAFAKALVKSLGVSYVAAERHVVLYGTETRTRDGKGGRE